MSGGDLVKPPRMPLLCLALCLLPALPALAEADLPREVVHHGAMNTEFVFTLYGNPDTLPGPELLRLAAEAFALVDDLEARISRWKPDSQVSALNRRAHAGPVKVSPDLFGLLRQCETLHAHTGGTFDVTVGPLIEVWKKATDEGRMPTEAERVKALALTNMRGVRLNEAGQTVAFAREGMMLDFGGIGKGLALDTAAERLREGGISSALLHAGSSTVLAIGTPPDAPGWTVQIEDPYNAGSQIGEVLLKDTSLSTSGSYRKFFEAEGKRFSHIVDPRTGLPAGGLASASAMAPTGLQSDALSTAFFVMGEEAARVYCTRRPECGAVLVPLAEGSPPEPVYINIGQHQE
jgi:FAD:protein FMN transferase